MKLSTSLLLRTQENIFCLTRLLFALCRQPARVLRNRDRFHRPTRLFGLDDDAQKRSRKCYREIRKELVCLRRKQSADDETYERGCKRPVEQNDFRIKIAATTDLPQITESPCEKQQIQSQGRNADLDSDLEVSHMHFSPDARIGGEGAHSNAEDWVVNNPFRGSFHEELALLE